MEKILLFLNTAIVSTTFSFGNTLSEDFTKLKSLEGKWQGTLERKKGLWTT